MSLNFENYQTEANVWLKKVAERAGIPDRDRAGRIFRAVLHALRDRLPTDEAAHLGAQLPIIWKGVYFDGYKPHRVPERIRNEQEWLQFICSKDPIANSSDFPSLDDAKLAFEGVMQALRELISPGQYEQVEKALHKDIKPEMI
ncbi:MAG: DUF2267 domain-containing protein [Bacteroidota bacterium]|nr:DUF2267 domain-containing protein [Bacteroidota bacterium]